MIPRWGREYSTRDALKALRTGWLNGPASGTPWGELWPEADVFPVRSGREGLCLILQALRMPRGARVGVPLFCCRFLFEAVIAAGHHPIFLDINLENYLLDLESLHRHRRSLAAVVAVHPFGYPEDLDAVRQCLGPGPAVIEDFAAGLLSEYHGRPLGSIAPLAFGSFGIHKPATPGGGGLVVVNDRARSAAVQELWRGLPEPSRWNQALHVARCWTRSQAYRPSVYSFMMATPWARRRDSAGGDPAEDAKRAATGRWRVERMRDVDAALLPQRLSREREAARWRCALAAIVRERGATSEAFIPADPVWGSWNYAMLPVRFPNRQERDQVRARLRACGVDSHKMWEDCPTAARHFGYNQGCPNAEQAAATVCTLPLHAQLTRADAECIGDALGKCTDSKSRNACKNESHVPAR